MRRPIRIQLLLPTLSVVILAILLASGTSAYLGAARAQRQQEESLRRVVLTLANTPTFPMSDRVLRQIHDLSGAEVVYLEQNSRDHSSTIPVSKLDLQRLQSVCVDVKPGQFPPGSRVVLDNGTYLADAFHRHKAAIRPGWLIVLYPESRWWAVMRETTYPALVAGALASLGVVVVTTMLAQRFARPIQRLGDQTAVIASGRFEPVAIPTRDDELRDLAVSINRMTQQLSDFEREVRRSERLRTLGQLGAAVAHQLRNSATGARMAIELHGLSCAEGLNCESLQVALRQLNLMESYLQRFLTLGRLCPESRGPVELNALAHEVLDLVYPMASHAGVRLDLVPGADSVEINGDPEALRQLLVNLLLNAIEAASRATNPRPRAVVVEVHVGAGQAVLAVGDTGPGPAAEIRPQMFEPFVTEKPEGTGLGLFVVREIATAHGGSVGFRRSNGKTWFEAEFPLLVRTHNDGASADC